MKEIMEYIYSNNRSAGHIDEGTLSGIIEDVISFMSDKSNININEILKTIEQEYNLVVAKGDEDKKVDIKYFSGKRLSHYHLPFIIGPAPDSFSWYCEVYLNNKILFRESMCFRDEVPDKEQEERVTEKLLKLMMMYGINRAVEINKKIKNLPE